MGLTRLFVQISEMLLTKAERWHGSSQLAQHGGRCVYTHRLAAGTANKTQGAVFFCVFLECRRGARFCFRRALHRKRTGAIFLNTPRAKARRKIQVRAQQQSDDDIAMAHSWPRTWMQAAHAAFW